MAGIAACGPFKDNRRRPFVIQYTLNTGHSVDQPRSAVSTEAIEVLRPLLDGGGAIPGLAPFKVSVTPGDGSAVFTVWRGHEPIVTCAVAWTAEGEAQAWPAIESAYFRVSDQLPQLMAPGEAAEKPDLLPWLAVVIWPAILSQARNDVAWLGDFERCMGWTILEERTKPLGGGDLHGPGSGLGLFIWWSRWLHKLACRCTLRRGRWLAATS